MTIQNNAMEESQLGGSLVASPLNEGSVDRLMHVTAVGGSRIVGLDDDFLIIYDLSFTGQSFEAVAFNKRGDLFVERTLGGTTRIRKIDACGQVQWIFNIGAVGRGLALSSDGSKLYVVALSNGLWTGSAGPSDIRNLWVLNTTTGALISSKQVGLGSVTLRGVVLDSSGNVIVSGTVPTGGGNNVFKLTPGLAVTWDWFNDTSSGSGQQINSLAVDSSDDIYAAGSHSNTWEGTDSSFKDVWKLSSGDGSVLASMLIGPAQFTGSGNFFILRGIDLDDADNVFVVGQVTAFYPGAVVGTTSLTADIDSLTFTIPVAAPALVDAGFLIRIDSEILRVNSGGLTTTWLAGRGVNGTTAASHLSGAIVTVNDALRDAFRVSSSLSGVVWSFLASVPGAENQGSLGGVAVQADGERIYICGNQTGAAPPRSIWQLDKDGLQELIFEVGAGFMTQVEVRPNR